MNYNVVEKGNDEELEEILNRDKNWKGQSMVSLDEMKILIEEGGEIIRLNKEVGTCYSHIVEYGDRDFYNVTANPLSCFWERN